MLKFNILVAQTWHYVVSTRFQGGCYCTDKVSQKWVDFKNLTIRKQYFNKGVMFTVNGRGDIIFFYLCFYTNCSLREKFFQLTGSFKNGPRTPTGFD